MGREVGGPVRARGLDIEVVELYLGHGYGAGPAGLEGVSLGRVAAGGEVQQRVAAGAELLGGGVGGAPDDGGAERVKRGVPSFHDGMATSSSGAAAGWLRSSRVLGRMSSPGWVMTILKPPGSDSRAMLVSGMVESDMARRWPRRDGILEPEKKGMRAGSGDDGGSDGVHWPARAAAPSSSGLCFSEARASRPAVPGGVMGKTKFGCG